MNDKDEALFNRVYSSVEEIPRISSFKTEGIEFAIPGLIAYGAITMISRGCRLRKSRP